MPLLASLKLLEASAAPGGPWHPEAPTLVPFGGASVGFSSREFLLISNKSHCFIQLSKT